MTFICRLLLGMRNVHLRSDLDLLTKQKRTLFLRRFRAIEGVVFFLWTQVSDAFYSLHLILISAGSQSLEVNN